jgi:aminoglycoside phosphotransferase (APT) family kinase protein
VVDTDAVTTAWDAAHEAPEWPDRPVWLHADLMPGNLLTVHGRLSAVIALPYYWDTNPAMAANARHVIREVLADHAASRRPGGPAAVPPGPGVSVSDR